MKRIILSLFLLPWLLLPGLCFGWGEVTQPQLYSDAAGLDADIVPGEVKRVQTISALRLVSGVKAGQAVDVLGYYAAGDGGGGRLRYWVTGAVPGTYADNGGSIIVPTGGDGSAAWLYAWSGVVNPKEFGAKGDGVTDDSVALERAINANAGGTLAGDGATYAVVNINITVPISVTGLKLLGLDGTAALQAPFNITADNVTIVNCTVTQVGAKFDAKSNLPALYASGADNLTIKNCIFVGGESNGTDDYGGVHLYDCAAAVIEGNKVSQTKFEGISLVNCRGCFIRSNTAIDCNNSGISTVNGTGHVIDGNTVDYVKTGTYLGASGISVNSTHTIVTGNRVNNSYLHGIVLGHTLGDRTNLCADYATVTANIITSYGRKLTATNGGITIDNALHSIINGNVIGQSINNTASSNYNNGILFTDTATNSVICTVSNNEIDTPFGSGIYATALPDAGAAVPSSLIISGNRVKNSWLMGIYVSKGAVLKITGNTIENANRADNANGSGIFYTYSATDPTELTIDRNTIIDATPHQRYGVMLSSMSATSAVKFHGNVIRGWVTRPYSDTTAATVDSRGNDYDGTSRSGSAALTVGTTRTVITTGQVWGKEVVNFAPGNAAAVTAGMSFAAGTVSRGTSITALHSTAPAGAAVFWSIQ